MTVKELYDVFCEKYPAHLSCSWDHDGLMVCEDFDAPVTGVVCTLDITDRAIDMAIERGCNVIISHHPMLFDPINYITPEKPISRRVLKLIKHGISIMCFHTRCDAAEGGTNTLMIEALGLENVEICDPDGIVRVGYLPSPLSAKDFATLVKEAFHVPFITLADCGKPIQKVAICSGGGGGLIGLAQAAGADAYVSGRLDYHAGVDVPEAGMTLVEAGHFYTEIGISYVWAKEMEEVYSIPAYVYDVPPIDVY